MDTKNMGLGAGIGCLLCAFTMFNLWLWNIVSPEQMSEFEQKQGNSFMLIGAFAAVILASAWLYAKFAETRSKRD